MRFEAEGLEAAIKAASDQVARLRDLTPAFKVYGRFVEKCVDDCFDRSEDWDGKKFPPLAESTIERRVGNLKAANKRSASGKLTKGAKALQDKMRSPGGIKPLVDTARARNSQHFIAGKSEGVWTSVGYLGYHFAGNDKLPARNVSPFVPDGDGWKLHPKAAAELARVIGKFVGRGVNAVEAAE